MVLAVALVGGALAVAQPSEKRERGDAPRKALKRGGHARVAQALAEKLGVSAAQVRDAFRATMAERRGRCGEKLAALAKELGVSAEELEKAKRAAGRRGPRALAEELGVSVEKLRAAMKAAREAQCTELANSFAAKLGKTGDEVRAAVKELAEERLAAAVKRGRLSEARAEKIRKRMAASPCMGLPLARHHAFGRRHHGFGARRFRQFRRHFRERFGERGERRDGSFEPRGGDRVPA